MLIEATNPFKCDRAIAMTKERTCCNAAMSEKRCATIREMKEGPFEVGNQVLISSHRKLLSSKAMVVNVAEKSESRFRQARLREASASEPQKCRNAISCHAR